MVKRQEAYKYYLLAFNVASLILAIGVMIIGLYMRYDWTFKHYIIELEAYQIWTGPFILMAASSLAMACSALGCWATVVDSVRFLFWFGVGEIVSAILMISGVTVTLYNGTYYAPITDWLTSRFHQLIYASQYDQRSARILKIIQEDVGCCGSDSWMDYDQVNMVMPFECRDQNTGNQHDLGCAFTFVRFIEPFTGWISGIALLLFVLQLFAIAVIFLLRREILKLDKRKDKGVYQPVRTIRT